MSTRNWCITIFNVQPYEHIKAILELHDHVKYCIWQEEKCPDTGRRHLQMYLESSKKVRLSAIKKLLEDTTIHGERRMGSRTQARDYCRKEESRVDGPWEYGEWEQKNPGRRTDLEQLQLAVQGGATEEQIADEFFGQYLRYHKGIEKCITFRVPDRDFKTQLRINWGAAGTGKSYDCFHNDQFGREEVYTLPRPNGKNVWFDGYEPMKHRALLLDDFYGWIPLHMLLVLADENPIQVPIKGGMRKFRAECLFITSNCRYDSWYDWDRFDPELRRAFERRIDECWHYNDPSTLGSKIDDK